MTTLTPDDWIAKGYKKFKASLYPNAEYGLQKMFGDENGKRYYINVWVYDRHSRASQSFFPEDVARWGFQPEVQFSINDETIDVAYHHKNSERWGVISIDSVEDFFQKLWTTMKCDYYEKHYYE